MLLTPSKLTSGVFILAATCSSSWLYRLLRCDYVVRQWEGSAKKTFCVEASNSPSPPPLPTTTGSSVPPVSSTTARLPSGTHLASFLPGVSPVSGSSVQGAKTCDKDRNARGGLTCPRRLFGLPVFGYSDTLLSFAELQCRLQPALFPKYTCLR